MNAVLISVQVSLLHVSNLPTVPPPTTCCRLSGLVWFCPESLPRSADRIPCGDHSVTWASPFASRLATTTGRIEFVILRTSRSPPVALHPLSRGRSYVRLRGSNPTSTGTLTLPIQYTHKRTRGRACPPRNGGVSGRFAWRASPPATQFPTSALKKTTARRASYGVRFAVTTMLSRWMISS